MGMGLATMFVLICSTVVISAIKNLIPDMVRIPSFIVVIASFVTLLQMIMQAYVPALYATLGLFLSLIHICILLLHHVLRVQYVGNRHQQAEQAEVASQERDMEREVDERIVSGKVVCPQEALLAEFNGCLLYTSDGWELR